MIARGGGQWLQSMAATAVGSSGCRLSTTAAVVGVAVVDGIGANQWQTTADDAGGNRQTTAAADNSGR